MAGYCKFSFCVFMDRDELAWFVILFSSLSVILICCILNTEKSGIMNTEKNDFRTCLFSSTEKKASYRLK